jgi:hypothetical protein
MNDEWGRKNHQQHDPGEEIFGNTIKTAKTAAWPVLL